MNHLFLFIYYSFIYYLDIYLIIIIILSFFKIFTHLFDFFYREIYHSIRKSWFL